VRALKDWWARHEWDVYAWVISICITGSWVGYIWLIWLTHHSP
jgi:hypothetical protein